MIQVTHTSTPRGDVYNLCGIPLGDGTGRTTVLHVTEGQLTELIGEALMRKAHVRAMRTRAARNRPAVECWVCDGHGTFNLAPCPNGCERGLIFPDPDEPIDAGHPARPELTEAPF